MTVFTGGAGKDLAIIIAISIVFAVLANIGVIGERLGWF